MNDVYHRCIEAVERALEQMFRRVLHDVTGDPPRLDEVQVHHSEFSDAVRIRAQFKVEGQPDWLIEYPISRHEVGGDLPSSGQLTYNADAIWSRCQEDHYVARMRAASVQAMVDAYVSGDLVTAELHRQGADQIGNHEALYHASTGQYNVAIGYSALYSNHSNAAVVFSNQFPIEVGTKEAQERGMQLLKENLSPQQLADYETKKHFDVKGGESGKTYRIFHGRQMNIEVLDGKGKREHGLCALPQGGLVAGDCMLAQKVAIECDEVDFLKVANRFM